MRKSSERLHISKEFLYKCYIVKNMTVVQIAKLLKCGKNTILNRLHKYEISKPRISYREHYFWSDERKLNLSINNPMKNPTNVEKSINTKRLKYGDDWANIINQKSFETYKERTGLDNPFQDVENIKSAMLQKYGVTSSNYIESSVAKRKISWDNVDKVALMKKRKATCLEKYGCEFPAQCESVQMKMRNTCKERFGVENIFLLDDLKYNIKSKYSKPNQVFAALLDTLGIDYCREFTIGMKSYDFKVDNYLIEINPFATHNSTWCAYGDANGIDMYYHFNKTKLALDSGYECIQVFDWVNVQTVLDILANKTKFRYTQLTFPRCFVYNIKSKEYFLKPMGYILDKNEVEIYDDGRDVLTENYMNIPPHDIEVKRNKSYF